MGRGRLPDSTPFNQRSIPSMFANSSLTAGRSGSSLPLMELLTPKLEKRSTQHENGQSDASLHPRPNKTGDKGQPRQTNIRLKDKTCSHHNQESEKEVMTNECTVLGGPPTGQRLGRKRQFADPGDTEVVNSPVEFLDRQRSARRRKYSEPDMFRARSASGSPTATVSVPARIAQGGDAGKDTGSGSGNFIDLTEYDDTVGEQDATCSGDGTPKARGASKSLEKCPICTELIPTHESLDGNRRDEALGLPTRASLGRNHVEETSGRAWQHQSHTQHDRSTGALVQFGHPFMTSKPNRLLVLGDDPKLRGRVTKIPSRKEQPNAVFNHYNKSKVQFGAAQIRQVLTLT